MHKVHRYELKVALPHTNLNSLTEFLHMMQAGNFQWASLSSQINMPLSAMRTADGKEVYATFFYIEENYPDSRLPNSFKLDDELTFCNYLRSFKNLAVDGRMVFGYRDEMVPEVEELLISNPAALKNRFPWFRMANVFICPAGGNDSLKMSPPANAKFDTFNKLPNSENAFQIMRSAGESGQFNNITPEFVSIDKTTDFTVNYEINPDRDTNGAGLVYFANYFAFMDFAERCAIRDNATVDFTLDQINYRTLKRREIVYFANANVDDRVRIAINMFRRGDNELAFRYKLSRMSDDEVIAISESIKVFPS